MLFRSMLSDLPVEISALGDGAPSKISDTNTESYELIRKTIEKHFGTISIIPTLEARSSDAIHYKNLSKNIYGFCPIMTTPKQEKSIHSVNEYIKKEDLGVATEFYKTFLSTM